MAWGHSVVLVVLALWPGVVSPASPTLNVTALGATLSVTDREWLAAAAAKVRGYDVLNRRCMSSGTSTAHCTHTPPHATFLNSYFAGDPRRRV
jgi:hypothetical protein